LTTETILKNTAQIATITLQTRAQPVKRFTGIKRSATAVFMLMLLILIMNNQILPRLSKTFWKPTETILKNTAQIATITLQTRAQPVKRFTAHPVYAKRNGRFYAHVIDSNNE
jgi:hypothetical protein